GGVHGTPGRSCTLGDILSAAFFGVVVGEGAGQGASATKVPEPCTATSQPSAINCSYARSTTPRATSSSAASFRELGNLRPTAALPLRISALRWSAIWIGSARRSVRSRTTATAEGRNIQNPPGS